MKQSLFILFSLTAFQKLILAHGTGHSGSASGQVHHFITDPYHVLVFAIGVASSITVLALASKFRTRKIKQKI